MGLLDQLWDDTMAGPPPENGLGKLRKHPTFSFRCNSDVNGRPRSEGEDLTAEEPRVTRSIMIRRPAGSTAGNGTPPLSPAGLTPPVSPFSAKGMTFRTPPSSSKSVTATPTATIFSNHHKLHILDPPTIGSTSTWGRREGMESVQEDVVVIRCARKTCRDCGTRKSSSS